MVWNMAATLMLAAIALTAIAVLAPQSLDTQIMGEPPSYLEAVEKWYVL